jgi:hypothetical protein
VATLDMLNQAGASAELRARLAEHVLARLADPVALEREELDEHELRSIEGWTHYHLALCSAAQNDRDGVLSHLRETIEVELDELPPEQLRDDSAFDEWSDDEEFEELYASRDDE